MWILRHKLRCARNSALLYFQKIKKSDFEFPVRLTRLQFLLLFGSPPAHAKCHRDIHGDFPLDFNSQWLLLSLLSSRSVRCWLCRLMGFQELRWSMQSTLQASPLPTGSTLELATGLPYSQNQILFLLVPLLLYPLRSLRISWGTSVNSAFHKRSKERWSTRKFSFCLATLTCLGSRHTNTWLHAWIRRKAHTVRTKNQLPI